MGILNSEINAKDKNVRNTTFDPKKMRTTTPLWYESWNKKAEREPCSTLAGGVHTRRPRFFTAMYMFGGDCENATVLIIG